ERLPPNRARRTGCRSMNEAMVSATRPRPWVWALLFIVAMGGASLASIYEMLAEPWRSIVNLAALSLAVPMALSCRRQMRVTGPISPAFRDYNRRILVAGGAYMLCFFASVWLYERVPHDSPVLWPLALVPVVPLFGMIWAMIRYLREETDEYLRHRAITAALVGLAVVLGLGTVWGFLETFGLAPHVWNWWVFPVWAVALGITQSWQQARDG